MKTKLPYLFIALACVAGSLWAAPPQYRIIDLGTLPGGSTSSAYGINDSNQVVGDSDSGDSDGNTHAFLYSYPDGTMQDLGVLPAGTYSHALGINNSEQVVGYADALYTNSYGSESTPHAFLYSTNGGMQNLGTFPPTTDPGVYGSYTEADGINNSGQIAGYGEVSYLATDSGEHAFLYQGGIFQDLGTAADSYNYGSEAYAINNSGQVVGVSYDAYYDNHAFLYSGGPLQDLGSLGGAISAANGINDVGQVVGDSLTASDSEDAFLYTGGVMQDLGVISNGTGSSAFGINNSGQIVGNAGNPSGNDVAFIYVNGIMYDLNTLVSSNNMADFSILDHASAINNEGWIVGYGNITGSEPGSLFGRQAFLAIPQTVSSTPPIFQATLASSNMITFTWSTVVSDVYQVQYTTNLNFTNWSNLGGSVTASNATAFASDSITNSQRFYRIMLLQ